MNNHGSRKVLQCKFDIEHCTRRRHPRRCVQPVDNSTTTRRTELRPRTTVLRGTTNLNTTFPYIPPCTLGVVVERTIALMTQHVPLETSGTEWPHLGHGVRQFVQNYPTCLKMDTRHKNTRASQFVLSTLKPVERISIDTIGPLPADMGLKCIIVVIDTFTRYVELFPKQEVTAIATADALWRHTCPFTAPLELITDFGSQFVNGLLYHFHQEISVSHTILRYRTSRKKMA